MSLRLHVCAALAVSCLSGASWPLAQGLTETEALQRFGENSQGRVLQFGLEALRAEMKGRSLPPNPPITYSRERAAGSREDYWLVEQSLRTSGRLDFLRRAGEAAADAQQHQSSHLIHELRSDSANRIFSDSPICRKSPAVLCLSRKFCGVCASSPARRTANYWRPSLVFTYSCTQFAAGAVRG